jgi:hypothetical protein
MNLPSHSRAITSKLFAAPSVRADFIALRFSPGSMLLAISLRHSSLFSRAFSGSPRGTRRERASFPCRQIDISAATIFRPMDGLLSRVPARRKADRLFHLAGHFGLLYRSTAFWGQLLLGLLSCPQCCPQQELDVNGSPLTCPELKVHKTNNLSKRVEVGGLARMRWWWPETGSNRRRRPFQGRALPLSYLALANRTGFGTAKCKPERDIEE